MEDFDGLTETIIGASYKVSNALGSGFLEKVYENALAVELRKSKVPFKQQFPLDVNYEGIIVGNYYADLLVNETVIVELKALKQLESIHTAQLMNYLKACNKRCGLLINFGKPRVEVKRILNGY